MWKCCSHFSEFFLRTPYGHTKINFSFLSSRTPLYSWPHNLVIIDNIFQLVLCSFIKSVSKKYENSFVVIVSVHVVTLSLILEIIYEWKPARRKMKSVRREMDSRVLCHFRWRSGGQCQWWIMHARTMLATQSPAKGVDRELKFGVTVIVGYHKTCYCDTCVNLVVLSPFH